jgi:hypothetical protein
MGCSLAASSGVLPTFANAQSASPARASLPVEGQPIRPLANPYVTLWQATGKPHRMAGTPGMTILPQGRLVATFQINGDTGSMRNDAWGPWRGRVLLSDDHGQSWREATPFPMTGARPIVAGKRLYVVGHNAGICVMASEDGGESWSPPARIRTDEAWAWYSQACSVVHTPDRVYFTMDHVTTEAGPPSRGVYAPVVMSAKLDSDWLQSDSWTFSNVLTYDAALRENNIASVRRARHGGVPDGRRPTEFGGQSPGANP